MQPPSELAVHSVPDAKHETPIAVAPSPCLTPLQTTAGTDDDPLSAHRSLHQVNVQRLPRLPSVSTPPIITSVLERLYPLRGTLVEPQCIARGRERCVPPAILQKACDD